MSLVIACQHERRRLAVLHELAIRAVDEARVVEIVIERVDYLLGRFGMVFEAFCPALEVGGVSRLHGTHAPDGLRPHG
jgi:hypothetical protein